MESIVKGTKASFWRETGSRTSSMTSETETNLSAHLVSCSPPWIMAVASTTAMLMPLVDLQLPTGRFGGTKVCWWRWGFGCGGGGWLLTTLLQQGADDGGSAMA